MQKRNASFSDALDQTACHATRDDQMDNIRFLMIFFVVFGHLIETFRGNDCTDSIYRCIYTFHMPVFLFLSGYFARFKPKAAVRKILLPYIVFQCLYLAFEFFILHNKKKFNLQFTTPFWLLWYLLVLFVYTLLLPLFQTDKARVAFRNLMICIVLSLVVGFDTTIEYTLSLSRIFVFLPFFVAGHYCAVFSVRSVINQHRRLAAVCSGGIILALEALIFFLQVPAFVFYGSLPYDRVDSNILIRLLFILCAFAWCVFFLAVVSRKRLRIITGIGQRTLPVFLLHGFLKRVIQTFKWLRGDPYINLLYAGGITIVLLLILSAPPLNKGFKKLF